TWSASTYPAKHMVCEAHGLRSTWSAKHMGREQDGALTFEQHLPSGHEIGSREGCDWYRISQTAHSQTVANVGDRMPAIDIRPGLTIAYQDDCFAAPWLTPEPVLLVHGNSESSRAWTQWVPYLAGCYRVIRIDMPGFGASTAPDGYIWSAGALAAD